MPRNAIVESLETRKLFNVTLTNLIGPEKTSSKYNYDVFNGSTLQSTQAEEILGPATFDGHFATRVKSVYTGVGSAPNSTVDQFITSNNTDGLIFYGSIETTVDGSTPETIRTNYEPFKIQAPPSLVAGKTFKYTFDQNVQTVTAAHTTTTLQTMTVHVTLISNATVPITVPAGKFQAYEVQDKVTTADGSDLVDNWFAPGVGLIKSVADDGGSLALTSFKL